MKKTNNSDNRAFLLIDFVVIQTLEPRLKLLIGKLSNELGCFFASIHEGLESSVSCILEADVVAEANFNQSVHLLFELKKSFDEEIETFEHLLVLNNSVSSVDDV